jgi:hypothetical protein
MIHLPISVPLVFSINTAISFLNPLSYGRRQSPAGGSGLFGLRSAGALGVHRRFELFVELLRRRRPDGQHAVYIGELDPVSPIS